MKIIIRIVLIVMILLTSMVIFGFSNQNAEESSGISMRITKFITSRIESIREKEQSEREIIENKIESVIRKIAHYTIYTFLGFLIMSFVSTYKLKELDRISISLISGVVYATTDEIHQIFILGRSGQITDVMLDSLGVLTGIFVSLFIIELIKKIRLEVRE